MVLDGMEEGDGGAFKCVFFLSSFFPEYLRPFVSFLPSFLLLSSFRPFLVSHTPFPWTNSLPSTNTSPQALAHALHLGLLRPRLQVGPRGHPCAARHLRRRPAADPEAEAEPEAEAVERGAARPVQPACAAAAAVGYVLRGAWGVREGVGVLGMDDRAKVVYCVAVHCMSRLGPGGCVLGDVYMIGRYIVSHACMYSLLLWTVLFSLVCSSLLARFSFFSPFLPFPYFPFCAWPATGKVATSTSAASSHQQRMRKAPTTPTSCRRHHQAISPRPS